MQVSTEEEGMVTGVGSSEEEEEEERESEDEREEREEARVDCAMEERDEGQRS